MVWFLVDNRFRSIHEEERERDREWNAKWMDKTSIGIWLLYRHQNFQITNLKFCIFGDGIWSARAIQEPAQTKATKTNWIDICGASGVNNANVAQILRNIFVWIVDLYSIRVQFQIVTIHFCQCIDEPKYEQNIELIYIHTIIHSYIEIATDLSAKREILQHLNNRKCVWSICQIVFGSFICAVDWTTLNSDKIDSSYIFSFNW